MSDKKFSVLGILAAVSIVLALVVSQYANKTKPSAAVSGPLLQGLEPENVSKITVKQGGATVTLDRKGDGFVIEEKDGYPAATKVINNLFTSASDIKTVESYTDNEKNYKDLGVTEEDTKGMISFFDSAGKPITGFILGKDTESGKGTYSYGKLLNDKKVFVLTDVPWIQSNAVEYTNQDLIYVKKDTVDWVTIACPNDNYSIISDANGAVAKLKEVPAGKKQKDSECLQVLGALSNLRFDDVMSESKGKDLVFDRKFNCKLKDSTLFNLELAKKGSDTYMRCKVDFTDKSQVMKDENVESQSELKKKEAKLIARDNAKKLADATNGWVYKIPSYMADNMTKPLKDLVEDIPVAKPKKDANEPNSIKK